MTGTEYFGFAVIGLACGIWLALPELRRRARRGDARPIVRLGAALVRAGAIRRMA